MLKNILFLNDGDKVHPGKQIGRNVDNFELGLGVYKREGYLFSGVMGFIRLEKNKNDSSSTYLSDNCYK